MPDISATRPATGAPIDTPWGQQVHDMLEGIQAGVVAISTTAVVQNDYVLTFPRAFASPPAVVVTASGGSVSLASLATIPTTTAVTIRVFKRDGSNNAVGSVTVSWLAIGTPA